MSEELDEETAEWLLEAEERHLAQVREIMRHVREMTEEARAFGALLSARLDALE